MTDPNNPLLTNFVDFLQTMNQNNQEGRAFVEELDQTKMIHDNDSENGSSHNSEVSTEEEIPDFFHIMEAEHFEKEGFIPKSLLRQSIYKEILKEEPDSRNKLLLYYSLYNTDKDISSVSILQNSKDEFEKIYLHVCWRFYSLLHNSSEFEDFVIEKILENQKYELFPYHLTFYTKVDTGLQLTEYEKLTKDKKKDESDYKELIHSIFNEVYM